MVKRIVESSMAVEREVISIRRQIHRRPELSYAERETSALVASKLRSLGMEVRTGVGGTGVVGVLRGGEGRVVGLRADMDALPINEEADVQFRSEVPGVMHACGHDAHTAILLGVAEVLASNRDLLRGSVKFLFQPAEEDGGRGGALPMIEDGALEDPHVDHVFGLHVMADCPAGVICYRPGPIMAAPDSFRVRVRGRGGHGSKPDDTVDPIFVTGQLINAIYGLRARMVPQTRPLVLSICSVHSGTKDNIIPDEAVIQGTIRTLDEELRSSVKIKLGNLVRGVCEALGAQCEVFFEPNAYPVTVNDPSVTAKAIAVLREAGFPLVEIEPIMGGEDVSRFLQRAPGMYYFLGIRNEQKGCVYPNHSSRFKIDEDVLKVGVSSLALLAVAFSSKE
ncbi:carboxypeptidase CpsA [Sulfodiicoccus acidiphilus]|uniref:carboxypeptidase CpsA n=1 Tax=Sulfodiicoccus acidiphilus TaxID=1670455 RepID=UPI00227D8F2D|nr:carboxypeptidase CpsA [Sulfodiicoccus acidiphilus]